MLKHLADGQSSAVCQLRKQYRMNESICQVSNDIAYKGALLCGNDEVRNRRLDLKHFPAIDLDEKSRKLAWLHQAIDPDFPVVFINTDAPTAQNNLATICPMLESKRAMSGGGVVNCTESSIVCHVVKGLLSCGLGASSIGVISPFRAQVRY